MHTQVVEAAGGLAARRAGIATARGVDRPYVLRQSAAVRERRAAAAADVRPCAGMADLVGAQSLPRSERLAALSADVGRPRIACPVYDLQ